MSDSYRDSVNINNVVASGDVGIEIDLDALADSMREAFGIRRFYEKDEEAYPSPDLDSPVSDGELETTHLYSKVGNQPGLYYEIYEDGEKSSLATFYTSGRYIVRADSEEAVHDYNDQILEELVEIDVLDEKPSESEVGFEIYNVVGGYQTRENIDLKSLYDALSIVEASFVEYEPEQFPAVVFQDYRTECKALIFKSGRVTITGGTSTQDVYDTMERLQKNIDENYSAFAV